MAEKEKLTASAKLGNFIEKNKKVVIGILIAAVVAVIAVVVAVSVKTKNAEKAIAEVDAISFALTDGSAALTEDELKARSDEALSNLASLVKKGGVGGVRANMLAAELAFNDQDYEAAISYWTAAAAKGKKSYTAPLAYYNKGVCYEQLNEYSEAAEAYKAAADAKDFVLANHAKFSYGRVLETKGDYAEAAKVYEALNDADPDDSWAKLAKTRMIALQVAGKVE